MTTVQCKCKGFNESCDKCGGSGAYTKPLPARVRRLNPDTLVKCPGCDMPFTPGRLRRHETRCRYIKRINK